MNKNGKLVGNISTRDLKCIDVDGKWWPRLFLPCWQFLEERQKALVYVLPSDTLETILKKIEKHQIHRLYVVNNSEERKPIGVVGLKEVLYEILPH